MPDLGTGLPQLIIAPPAGPTIALPPPTPANLLLVPGSTGPMGPEGPAGTVDPETVEILVADYLDANPPAAESHIERAYAVASDTWEWDHGLGYTPAVTVMNAARQQVFGTVLENGPTRTVVTFWLPVAGILALA